MRPPWSGVVAFVVLVFAAAVSSARRRRHRSGSASLSVSCGASSLAAQGRGSSRRKHEGLVAPAPRNLVPTEAFAAACLGRKKEPEAVGSVQTAGGQRAAHARVLYLRVGPPRVRWAGALGRLWVVRVVVVRLPAAAAAAAAGAAPTERPRRVAAAAVCQSRPPSQTTTLPPASATKACSLPSLSILGSSDDDNNNNNNPSSQQPSSPTTDDEGNRNQTPPGCLPNPNRSGLPPPDAIVLCSILTFFHTTGKKDRRCRRGTIPSFGARAPPATPFNNLSASFVIVVVVVPASLEGRLGLARRPAPLRCAAPPPTTRGRR
jgi:hypothetical protein